MEKREDVDVISITGMPGIGKTTLAWKIYQDEKIQENFNSRIWINLPQVFDSNDLYVRILKEFCNVQPDDEHDLEYLKRLLYMYLGKIKFLLVLDNVRTLEAWNCINAVLQIGNKKRRGGKVLITSQNVDVCTDASRKPYMLHFLNKRDSWELLQLQVFGELNICPLWLQSIGEIVAENCKGLPLAIEIIGRNLVVATSTGKAKELTRHWWEKVGRNVSMYVTEYYKQLGGSSVLDLSYNILPQRLRDCFLYLGVFPEDYEIPTRTLTRLWIAEGFIGNDTESGQSLEERAEGVLEDLIRSNLVTVGKLYYNGKVKTCRVHRVIHGFCKSKASALNLFHEIRMSEEGGFDPPLSLTPNYRRLCIHSHLFEYLFGKPKGPGVRSFLCFQNENIYVLEAKSISTIHKTFEFLKVFEFKSIRFLDFPTSLTRLMNLTYISLSCDRLAVIPETISHLLNLQTLVVATRSPVLEIKGNIWRMIRLRHLITEAAITLPKQGEGEGGDELQTLTSLSPEYCTQDVFNKARCLKKLGIRGKLRLDHFERLKPKNESFDNLNSLDPSCFPSSLTSLTISATYLDWEHMLTLGKMVHLKVLKLKNNASRGDSWKVTDDGVFLCLEFLFIGSTDLVSWEVSPHCFPRLRCLMLKKCEKLDKIPFSLSQTLKTLEVEHVSESAQQSAMEIQEMVRKQGQQEGSNDRA